MKFTYQHVRCTMYHEPAVMLYHEPVTTRYLYLTPHLTASAYPYSHTDWVHALWSKPPPGCLVYCMFVNPGAWYPQHPSV